MMSLFLTCLGSHALPQVLIPLAYLRSRLLTKLLSALNHLFHFFPPHPSTRLQVLSLSYSLPEHTLIGTPFSTFTRTIAIALVEKGIPFKQIRTAPHSELADEFHPYGYVPILVIPRPNGKDVHLRESQAIAMYLDRIAPMPTLGLDETDTCLPEKMWEFVSLVVSFGYPAIKTGVVQPRVCGLDACKFTMTEIRQQIKQAGGLDNLKSFLTKIEQLFQPDGPYIFGSRVTWADAFLYPLIADLMAVPEGMFVSTRILKWAKTMELVEGVKQTFDGTLAARGRP
ncbi:glutathione S-transferase [Ceratobasidium sp. AG-Ba]|nr:glutathione S-transferase [Ceratobasidium sp. AG-Ba]QRW05539.1 glutathione S-transferase [Ceratobasidium sp. AG-Ba]